MPGRLFRHLDMTDLRMITRGNLLRRIRTGRHGPLHVGLPRTEPHLTDQHVADHDSIGGGHQQHVRTAGFHFRQGGLPAAVGVSTRYDDFAITQLEAHGFTRIRPSPDGNGDSTLQHHVITKESGQFQVGPHATATDQSDQQNQQETKHQRRVPARSQLCNQLMNRSSIG